MNLSPEELEKAKAAIDKLRRENLISTMSKEDQELMRKYPKHTLAAAREIDATPLDCPMSGLRSAFDLLRLQETGRPIHISGDHT
jgi:hypothetical protein